MESVTLVCLFVTFHRLFQSRQQQIPSTFFLFFMHSHFPFDVIIYTADKAWLNNPRTNHALHGNQQTEPKHTTRAAIKRSKPSDAAKMKSLLFAIPSGVAKSPHDDRDCDNVLAGRAYRTPQGAVMCEYGGWMQCWLARECRTRGLRFTPVNRLHINITT
jgi:hypothetical protein